MSLKFDPEVYANMHNLFTKSRSKANTYERNLIVQSLEAKSTESCTKLLTTTCDARVDVGVRDVIQNFVLSFTISFFGLHTEKRSSQVGRPINVFVFA